MSDIKTIIGLIAVTLTFIGYFPYIRDILRGKTKPHVFSWLVWSILTAIIYALQTSAGAGSGSWVTLSLVAIMVLIFVLSLKSGYKKISKSDKVVLVLTLCALPIWTVIKQPVISIVLLSTIDLLAFVPTVRKSWQEPYTETLSFYIITTLRHALSLMALAEYNIVTYLFPASWVIVNGAFACLLIIRRRKLGSKPISRYDNL